MYYNHTVIPCFAWLTVATCVATIILALHNCLM